MKGFEFDFVENDLLVLLFETFFEVEVVHGDDGLCGGEVRWGGGCWGLEGEEAVGVVFGGVGLIVLRFPVEDVLADAGVVFGWVAVPKTFGYGGGGGHEGFFAKGAKTLVLGLGGSDGDEGFVEGFELGELLFGDVDGVVGLGELKFDFNVEVHGACGFEPDVGESKVAVVIALEAALLADC